MQSHHGLISPLLKQRLEGLEVSVGRAETGRSRGGFVGCLPLLLSPSPPSLSLSLSRSLSVSGSPSGGAVVVCLLASSYRLTPPLPRGCSVPAAPRLLHPASRGVAAAASHGLPPRSSPPAAAAAAAAAAASTGGHTGLTQHHLFYSASCVPPPTACAREMKCCSGG